MSLNDATQVAGIYDFNEEGIDLNAPNFWAKVTSTSSTFYSLPIYAADGGQAPYGFNDYGYILGNSETNAANVNFLYQISNGTFTQLFMSCPDQLPGNYIYPYGINGFNQIVGVYYDTSGNEHGFQYDFQISTGVGSCIPINPPGSTESEAISINNQGQIFGTYHNSTATYSFLLDGGYYYVLGDSLAGIDCYSCYINDAAQVTTLSLTVLNPE